MLLAVLTIAVWLMVLGSRPVSNDPSPVRVTIPKGATANEISSILKGQGLIRSSYAFVFTCRMSGTGGKLRPGVYELRRTMPLPEIIKNLVRGESLESWVTFQEGWTARQMADVLEGKQIASGDSFVQLAINGGYEFPEYSFVSGDNLEGYLFPDTYLIAKGTGAHAIVEKMLQTFETKVVAPNKDRIRRVIQGRLGLDASGFEDGLARILTMASMVEREARIPKDRALVAAVLWNRLKKGMRLEVDATVTYKPGESRANKAKVYYSDLRSDSPYNTYRHGGLPPAPICNPGLAAINAVLEPAQVSYLYYVARPDGSHVFSNTFQEHEKARNAIRNGKS